jgi:hypothetical protein
MKKILRLSLAFIAIAMLSACPGIDFGGDGFRNYPIDKYVDTWKSKCFSYVATDGNTYFTKRIRNFSYTEAKPFTELAITTSYDFAFYDAACTQSVGSGSSSEVSAAKLTHDGEVKFLGQSVDSVTWTELNTGEVLSGYMNADKQVMYLVTFKTGETPSAWGVLSPYTRQ